MSLTLALRGQQTKRAPSGERPNNATGIADRDGTTIITAIAAIALVKFDNLI
jgi:hypothetical protein